MELREQVLHYLIGPSLCFDSYNIIEDLEHVLSQGIPGDVVEFGCYKGNTSRVITATLEHYATRKKLYVYDSFEGLPAPNEEKGDGFKQGDLACTEEDLIRDFNRFGVTLPIITKGWFNELTKEQIPEIICYGFLDGDNYDSIKDSLTLIWDNIYPMGMVGIHDYFHRNLRGVKVAVDEFTADKHCRVFRCRKDDDKGNDIITIQKYS